MKALLLAGSNAVGKTTLMMRLREQHQHRTDILWAHVDNCATYGVDVEHQNAKFSNEKQLPIFWEWWIDPRIQVLVVEGVRAYANILRCAAHWEGRRLHVAMMLQMADAMRSHLKQRCVKASKTFNAAYWTDQKCQYEGEKRYTRALDQHQRLHPGNLAELSAFWIDDQYKALDQVEQWVAARL